MRLRSFLTVAAAALVIGLWGALPAAAEDDRGVVSTIHANGSYSFRKYQYPSKTTDFFIYPKSYVTFDAVNGQYWSVDSARSEYELNYVRTGFMDVFPFLDGRYALTPERMDVSFYTPDMRLLGSFNKIRENHNYSVPRDRNDYERIIVKIESDAKENFSVKMNVWDPVDAIIAEPIPHQIYRR